MHVRLTLKRLGMRPRAKIMSSTESYQVPSRAMRWMPASFWADQASSSTWRAVARSSASLRPPFQKLVVQGVSAVKACSGG